METYQDEEKRAKEEAEFFDLFAKLLPAAKEEYFNRMHEEEYLRKQQEFMKENLRIPSPEWHTDAGLADRGWVDGTYGWEKNGFRIAERITLIREGYAPSYPTIIKRMENDQVVFAGRIFDEESFQALEEMLGISNKSCKKDLVESK